MDSNNFALEIQRFAENGWSAPFPYKDCWKLFAKKPRRMTEGFIPDLDYFSFNIYGYATSAASYKKWSKERTDLALQCAEKSFAEQHPEYALLLREVNKVDYPHLFYDLIFIEQLRVMLLQLLETPLDASLTAE